MCVVSFSFILARQKKNRKTCIIICGLSVFKSQVVPRCVSDTCHVFPYTLVLRLLKVKVKKRIGNSRAVKY